MSVASDPGRRVQHNMLSPFHSPFQSPFRSPMRSPFRSPFKSFGHPGGRTIDFDCEDDEMNLNCFILMFDLLLKQVAEAWASFSSAVKNKGTLCTVILAMYWTLTYEMMQYHSRHSENSFRDSQGSLKNTVWISAMMLTYENGCEF